jgi:hypothetical protein
MNTRVGVWIDHKKALIVPAGSATVTVVPSDVESHTRFAGGGGYPGGNSSLRGGSERRGEERHRNALDHYFDEVIERLGHAREILILGPGEAKQQLADRLERSKAKPAPAITVDAADKMTEAQVVARVSAYFDAHR